MSKYENSRATSRRTVLASSAWAAPAVLAASALPSFAASNPQPPEYYLGSSGSMEYGWDSTLRGATTAVTFTSDVSAPADDGYIMPRGFNVLYKEGSGKSTTATLTGPLYYYVAVPSSLTSSFELVNASTSQWDGPVLVKSNVTRYPFFGPNKPVTNLANGAYDGLWNVYRLTFTGSRTNTTALMTTTSEPSSWPGSSFTLVGKDAPAVDDAKVPYWCGAVGSFTTADGTSATMIGSVIAKWTETRHAERWGGSGR